jgi:hypothetical protein
MPTPQHAPMPAPRRGNAAQLVTQNEQTLLAAYQTRGGVARGDELVSLVRTRADQPLSRVARWIVDRDALQFRLQDETVFPLFQFDMADMSVRADVRRVMAELTPAFDNDDMAQWFVRQNAWIAGSRPVDLLARDVDSVVAAARADRCMLLG